MRNTLSSDIRSASFSFSAGTAETVSGGCNATPPPRRHGNLCARGAAACLSVAPFFISQAMKDRRGKV